MPDIDTYDLPPTQALVLEVLAARARLGETHWTFSARHRTALEALAKQGLISWKHGIVAHTCMAWLTDAGRSAVLDESYRPPGSRLLEEAFFLRQNGEHAPGGNENWHDWERRTEVFLRSLLPPETRKDN